MANSEAMNGFSCKELLVAVAVIIGSALSVHGQLLPVGGQTTEGRYRTVALATDLPTLTETVNNAQVPARLREGEKVVTIRRSSAHTFGDGGGGQILVYSALVGGTVDGGFIYDAPGAGAERFIAVDQTVVNARQFGAVGDGSTDDTAAINACLAKNKGVYFPSGTYKITIGLVIPVAFKGEIYGDGPTTILSNAIVANPANPLFLLGEDVQFVEIRDMEIIGNGLTGASGNGHAISLIDTDGGTFSPQRVNISRVNIRNHKGNGKSNTGASMPAAGVYVRGALNNTAKHTIVFGCNHGWYLDGASRFEMSNMTGASMCSITGLTARGSSLHTVLEGCDFTDNGINPVPANWAPSTSYSIGNRVRIVSNGIILEATIAGTSHASIEPTGAGTESGSALTWAVYTSGNIILHGTNQTSIVNNRIKSGTPFNIDAAPTTAINQALLISGNSFSNVEAGDDKCIRIGNGMYACSITSNLFDYANAVTSATPIDVVQALGGWDVVGLEVIGNYFSFGQGMTVPAVIRLNVTGNSVKASRIALNSMGDFGGASMAFPVVITTGIALTGNSAEVNVSENTFVAGPFYTIGTAISIGAGAADTVLRSNSYDVAGGTITTQVGNAGTRTSDSVAPLTGSGAPNGVVIANPGRLYISTAGGNATTLYVKETLTGNTGWIAYGRQDNLGNHIATTTLAMTNQSISTLNLGTIGAPSISFNGDANTGMFSPGANQICLVADGQEVLQGTDSLVMMTNGVSLPATVAASTDATPTVLRAASLRTANASATTITNFDDGIQDQVFHLHVNDANTTIAHNATIALKKGANYLAVTGDVIEFYRNGTVWREVGNTSVAVGAGDNLGSGSPATHTAGQDIAMSDFGVVNTGRIAFDKDTVASATSINVTGMTWIEVTGTTLVTDIQGTGLSGQVIILLFDAGGSLEDNTTIQLAGNVNFTPTNEASITLINDNNAAWREIARAEY